MRMIAVSDADNVSLVPVVNGCLGNGKRNLRIFAMRS
jgi:hypothetical protein